VGITIKSTEDKSFVAYFQAVPPISLIQKIQLYSFHIFINAYGISLLW